METTTKTQEQAQQTEDRAKHGGVKTEAGKAKTRFNAKKHGILSQVLTTDDELLLQSFVDQLYSELQPDGFLEEILIERVAIGYLRLHRAA